MNGIWTNKQLMELANDAYISAAQNDCITSIYKRKDVMTLAHRKRIEGGIGNPVFLSDAELPPPDDFVEIARVTPNGLRLKWNWLLFRQPAPKNPYDEMLNHIHRRETRYMKDLEIEERAYIDLLNTIMLLRHTPSLINPKHGIDTNQITRPIVELDDNDEVPFSEHLDIVIVMKKLAKCLGLSIQCRQNILRIINKSYSNKTTDYSDYAASINEAIDNYLNYLNLTQTKE